jgi:hypothetical protein
MEVGPRVRGDVNGLGGELGVSQRGIRFKSEEGCVWEAV